MQILITKTTTSLLQLPTWTPPLQVFYLLDPPGMSQRRRSSPLYSKTVIKFGPDCMRTPDKECECVTCAFETLVVLAVEEERLLSL